MNVGELIISSLAGPLETIASAKLQELFDKLHDKNPDGLAPTLKSLHIGAMELKTLTDKTKTKIDDAIVDAMIDAVEASADKYDIELPV